MMENQFLPSYTIGSNAYEAVPEVCGFYGKTAVVIGGNKARKAAEKRLLSACKGALEVTGSFLYGDDATYENADALANLKEVQEADMIFAVGGGRAVDTVKKTAGEMNKPIFTFPTLASNCAPVTAVGAYYYPNHAFRSVWYRTRPAFHTFIDTQVIAEAPAEYFWAGIGDALSKQYEVVFSSRGDTLTYSQSLGVQLAHHCSDGLLQHGEEALNAVKNQTVNDAVDYVTQNIICSTGIISNLVPEDYNSSLAHALYNSHTGTPHEGKYLHGAVVVWGVLVLLTMDGQTEERNKLYDFCKRTQLPHKLAHIGIKDPTELVKNALTKPDLRKIPYEVTEAKVMKAIEDLEKLN